MRAKRRHQNERACWPGRSDQVSTTPESTKKKPTPRNPNWGRCHHDVACTPNPAVWKANTPKAARKRRPVSDGRSRRPCGTPSEVGADRTGAGVRTSSSTDGTPIPYPPLDTLTPMAGVAHEVVAGGSGSGPVAAAAPAPAERAGPGAPLAAWATWAVLAAWCLVGVGISAHDGEYSSWGLGALVLAALLLSGVAASGVRLAPASRRMLLAPAVVAVAAAA